MRKISLTTALVVAALPSAALAEKWLPVGITANQDQFSVDFSSIRTMPSGHRRVWVKVDFGKPSDAGDTGYKTFSELDCREGRSRTLSAAFFANDTITRKSNKPRDWQDVARGSVFENVLYAVCFGRLPR
ncbi:surface-adhesin E family protein [Altererythrobacter litoralis]|uniref:surface-adhesin E family protein n=1 Tax=Altererythrobacter litoralis TaxID=3113904 RepID=UPI00339B8C4B